MANKKNENKSSQEAVKEKAEKIKEEQKNATEQDDSKKDDKQDNQSNEEWLEEEIDNLGDDPSDELMKRAAERIEKCQEEINEWKDNYLRLHAEWDTYRRRTAERREAEKASATETLVTDLLPVLDDFERSIDYAQENGEVGLLDGVKAVHSKLVASLEKNGTEVIDPEAGEAFNALEHQAVSTVEDKEMFNESIANVMQKGYKMGNKVIRPAMVAVTTGGESRPKEEDEEN